MCSAILNFDHEASPWCTFCSTKDPVAFMPVTAMMLAMEVFRFVNFDNSGRTICIIASDLYWVAASVGSTFFTTKIGPVNFSAVYYWWPLRVYRHLVANQGTSSTERQWFNATTSDFWRRTTHIWWNGWCYRLYISISCHPHFAHSSLDASEDYSFRMWNNCAVNACAHTTVSPRAPDLSRRRDRVNASARSVSLPKSLQQLDSLFQQDL